MDSTYTARVFAGPAGPTTCLRGPSLILRVDTRALYSALNAERNKRGRSAPRSLPRQNIRVLYFLVLAIANRTPPRDKNAAWHNIRRCVSVLLIVRRSNESSIFVRGVRMSFIRECVAGSLMDLMMGRRAFTAQRAELLTDVRGEVLEIGFGTGLNLPHYTSKVARLTILDPAEFLPKRVAARISAAPFPVERVRLSAERLPFEDDHFDYVISTWTLCTIPDLSAALREVRRVLKPTGHFVFLEHGRSDDGRVACWQDRLNPIQRFIGGGCNLNRKIDEAITAAGLRIQRLDRYSMAGPRPWTEMYRGLATSGK